jgi:hypothetical protein
MGCRFARRPVHPRRGSKRRPFRRPHPRAGSGPPAPGAAADALSAAPDCAATAPQSERRRAAQSHRHDVGRQRGAADPRPPPVLRRIESGEPAMRPETCHRPARAYRVRTGRPTSLPGPERRYRPSDAEASVPARAGIGSRIRATGWAGTRRRPSEDHPLHPRAARSPTGNSDPLSSHFPKTPFDTPVQKSRWPQVNSCNYDSDPPDWVLAPPRSSLLPWQPNSCRDLCIDLDNNLCLW